MDRMEDELDNLRVALTWAMQHTPKRIMRLADELGWFWHGRGYLSEGRRWLEQAQAQATNLSAYDQARVLGMIGFMAREMNDLATAQALLEECLRGYQVLSDEAGQAETLNRLSMVALSYGDYVTTDRLTSQSIAIYRRLGSEEDATGPFLLAGEAAFLSHDYERAQIAYTESLRLANKAGWPRSAQYKMIRLGQIAQARGAPDQAVAQILAALRLASQINNKWAMIIAITGLANVAVTLDKPLLAVRLLAAVDRHLTRSGMRLWPVDNRQYDQAMTVVRAQLDEVSFEHEWTTGCTSSLEQLIEACNEIALSHSPLP